MIDEETQDMPPLLRRINAVEIRFLQFQPETYPGLFIKQTIVDGDNGSLLEIVWTRQTFLDGISEMLRTGEWMTKPPDNSERCKSVADKKESAWEAPSYNEPNVDLT